jgi:hypothetical protein
MTATDISFRGKGLRVAGVRVFVRERINVRVDLDLELCVLRLALSEGVIAQVQSSKYKIQSLELKSRGSGCGEIIC